MIDTKNMAWPKPGHDAGIQKLSPAEYAELRRTTWLKQNKRCGHCGKVLQLGVMQLHHHKKRGMGGANRDDRDVVGVCPKCHDKEDGGMKHV